MHMDVDVGVMFETPPPPSSSSPVGTPALSATDRTPAGTALTPADATSIRSGRGNNTRLQSSAKTAVAAVTVTPSAYSPSVFSPPPPPIPAATVLPSSAVSAVSAVSSAATASDDDEDEEEGFGADGFGHGRRRQSLLAVQGMQRMQEDAPHAHALQLSPAIALRSLNVANKTKITHVLGSQASTATRRAIHRSPDMASPAAARRFERNYVSPAAALRFSLGASHGSHGAHGTQYGVVAAATASASAAASALMVSSTPKTALARLIRLIPNHGEFTPSPSPQRRASPAPTTTTAATPRREVRDITCLIDRLGRRLQRHLECGDPMSRGEGGGENGGGGGALLARASTATPRSVQRLRVAGRGPRRRVRHGGRVPSSMRCSVRHASTGPRRRPGPRTFVTPRPSPTTFDGCPRSIRPG